MKPTTWLKRRAHQDSDACSCCFDRVQQPLNHVALERVLAPSAFTLSFNDRFGLHRTGFHLKKTEDAFCERCPTAPPLCAPGSIKDPTNSSFRSRTMFWSRTAKVSPSIAIELLQWVLSKTTSNPASPNFTQKSSIMASSEALDPENRSTSSAYPKQLKDTSSHVHAKCSLSQFPLPSSLFPLPSSLSVSNSLLVGLGPGSR